LSNAQGRIDLHWRLVDDILELDWKETGGPSVDSPSRRGFGTSLVERSLKAEGGAAHATFRPEGLHWKLLLPHGGALLPQEASEDGAEVAPDPADETGRSWSESLEGKSILVVEDEPLVALDIVSLLTDAGVKPVGPAATAGGAIEIIEQVKLDAALLDGNLQGEGVDDVAAALTERKVPFLFVSGYGPDHFPGFADAPILTKPFNPELLLESITRIIGRDEAEASRIAEPSME
jgi:CheY-like chemotaxis protein